MLHAVNAMPGDNMTVSLRDLFAQGLYSKAASEDKTFFPEVPWA